MGEWAEGRVRGRVTGRVRMPSHDSLERAPLAAASAAAFLAAASLRGEPVFMQKRSSAACSDALSFGERFSGAAAAAVAMARFFEPPLLRPVVATAAAESVAPWSLGAPPGPIFLHPTQLQLGPQ